MRIALNKKYLSLIIAPIVGATLILTPQTAQARELSALKDCTEGNPFEFSVDWERNKVDFDFDIERGQAFEKWSIRITRDGKTMVRDRLSADEDGDLSREYVRRGQQASGERWSFVAKSQGGNSCRAVLQF